MSEQDSTGKLDEVNGNVKDKVKLDETKQVTRQPSPEKLLLVGPMPELKKMKVQELKAECQMWRNLWGWIPTDMKEFFARTGKTMRIVRRDYKGFLGVLLETRWDLRSIDLGTFEKVYDSNDGKYYFERKIIRIGAGQLINIEWLEEREPLEGPDTPIPQTVETEPLSDENPDGQTVQ